MPNMTVKDLRGWKVETHLARESLRSFHETCRANVRRFYDPDEEGYVVDDDFVASMPSEWSTPALVTRYIQTKLANLYLQEPEFSLIADQPMYSREDGTVRDPETDARILQAGLNHFYKTTNQAEEDAHVIVDCLLCGIGMKLHGYHTSFVYHERLDPANWQFGYAIGGGGKSHFHVVAIGVKGKGRTSTDSGHRHSIVGGEIEPARAEGQKKEHTHIFQPVLSPIEQQPIIQAFRQLEFGDRPWEYDQHIQKQSPWGKELFVTQALWDPRAKRMSGMNWFGYWEWRQLADIKSFPLFKEAARGLESDFSYKGYGRPAETHEGLTTRKPDLPFEPGQYNADYLKYVKVYTLYIKRDIVNSGKPERNDKVLVYVEGYDKPLCYIDNPFDLDGYPVALLKWLPAPNRFTTIADVSLWQDVFDDYCHFRRILLKKADKLKRHYFCMENAVEGKKSIADIIANAQDGEAISLNPAAGNRVSDLVHVFDEPPLPTDLWNMQGQLRQEIRELGGESEISGGTPLTGGKKTATEIMKFEEARGKLLGIEQASVLNYLKRSGEITLSNLQQFYSGQTMVEIITSMGEKQLLPFTRHEAMTRCRLDVVPESMAPMDKQFRRWELTNLLQIIMQAPHLMQMINKEGWVLFMKGLFESYRLPIIGRMLNPPDPQMMAQMMMQGQQGGKGLMPTGGGMDAILGNVTGQGAGEGGFGAGQTEPMTQGVEMAAPMGGHVSGQGARR